MVLYIAYSDAGQFIAYMCQIWLAYVSLRKRYVSTLSYFWLTLVLKQGYRYHKIRKAIYKFYHRHSELIVKYNIGLKNLLQQGTSEPIFYGDLVYKFKRIVGKPNFSDQIKKIVKR